MAVSALEFSGLSKWYGTVEAVHALDITVAPGEILGLLGPNGAGKTTTVRMATGLCIPTSGVARILGYDIQRAPLDAKRALGYVPDRPYVYEKLTGQEFIQFLIGLYRVPLPDCAKRYEEFLELFELGPWKDEPIESYSHGMRQKLVLMGALLHQPQVLIIDEPMVGLDPKGAKIVKELFKSLAQKGVGILLSTHSMELVEKICHRIAILQHGRLVTIGTFDELTRQALQPEGTHLEEIFLTLTGSTELSHILKTL